MMPTITDLRRAIEESPNTYPPKYPYNNETLNDRWIAEYVFPGKRSGYFLEAGAANGRAGSSCYVLEHHLDWRGLCIEPNPTFFEALIQNRPNSICENICLSDRPETVTFMFADGDPNIAPYISGIKSNLEQYKWEGDKVVATATPVELPAVPLVALLRKHNAPKIIDFATFDIEGSEFKVLESFPFDEYCFLTLTVEADEWVWEKLFAILEPHGYREIKNPFNPHIWEKYCVHEQAIAGF